MCGSVRMPSNSHLCDVMVANYHTEINADGTFGRTLLEDDSPSPTPDDGGAVGTVDESPSPSEIARVSNLAAPSPDARNSRFSETAAAIARLGIFPRVRHFCLDDGHCFWWWVSDDALKTRRCPEEDCGDAEYNSPFE